MNTLNRRVSIRLVFLFLFIAALLFIPAGTFDYWEAWTFFAVYIASTLALILYLVKNDPQLLQRRMRGGAGAEKRPTQRTIMRLARAGFMGLIVVPALDHRFGWSHMPPAVALAGDVLIVLGTLIIFFVFKENTVSSATIELAPDQKVIATGPYALVRHPMYDGGLILLAGMPIALGSWWGLLVIVVVLPAPIWRLLDEENFLAKNLAGYPEYQKKVQYRLVPFVW